MHQKVILEENRRLIANKNYFGSIILLSRLIKIQRSNFEALNLRGYSKNLLGFYFSAIEDFNKSLNINEKNSACLRNRGFAKYQIEDFKGAIKDLIKSNKLEKNHKTFYILANCYKKLLMFNEALLNYDISLSLKDDFFKCFYRKGQIFLELNNYYDAKLNFQQAIKICKNHQQSFRELAFVCEINGDIEEAFDIYRKFLNQSRENLEKNLIFEARGKLFQRMRMYSDAIRDFSEIINFDKKDSEIFYRRAICQHGLQNFRKALEDFNIAIKIRKNHSPYYLSRAITYLSIQKKYLAYSDLKKAITIDLRNTDAYYYLVEVYENIQDKIFFNNKGIKILETLRKNPDFCRGKIVRNFNINDFYKQKRRLTPEIFDN